MSPNQQASPDLSTPGKIRGVLHQALGKLGNLEECALLNYPNYPNIGDHLIWLGTVLYLAEVPKTQIKYAASIESFSDEELDKRVGKAPILLQGGGNLGDLWSHHQKFREYIISKYRDRPIIILPQSIYFANPDNISKAAAIFNAHPNLTIFVRDDYSYEIASLHFSNCKIVKSPDMIFHMADMSLLSLQPHSRRQLLYLCRKDGEMNDAFSPKALKMPNLIIQDWVDSGNWIYRGRDNYSELKGWYWRIPGMVLLVREGWQRRGFIKPNEWRLRYQWERFQPYTEQFNTFYNPFIYHFSWSLMHSGVYQLSQNRLVITNRLHAHLLCNLLKIPNIFLPNSYYKNEAFYKSWTYQLPYCKFVKEVSEIKVAIEELSSIC